MPTSLLLINEPDNTQTIQYTGPRPQEIIDIILQFVQTSDLKYTLQDNAIKLDRKLKRFEIALVSELFQFFCSTHNYDKLFFIANRK